MSLKFNDLLIEVQKEVIKARKILNSTIMEDSAVQRDVYIDVKGERRLRKIRFRLNESEGGEKSYEFDCLL